MERERKNDDARRVRRGRGDDKRAARARRAQDHTEEMGARYAKEIEASVQGVRRIEGAASACSENPEHAGEGRPVCTVNVIDADAVSAVLAHGRGRAQFCDMSVLDCASFTHPGGGFDRGAWGQEETLCADSFLFNVLASQADWYAENRRRNINCNLFRNRALMVPRVRFSREKVHAYADVIVAAAPQAERAISEYGVGRDVLERAMRDRIRFILGIADELGHEKLVLSAFGCGVPGWQASDVAEMMREELALAPHAAREVYLAVPHTRFNDDHERFLHAFAAFPERNDESYEQVKAARAAAAQAAAESEEDEVEDDWRKYL